MPTVTIPEREGHLSNVLSKMNFALSMITTAESEAPRIAKGDAAVSEQLSALLDAAYSEAEAIRYAVRQARAGEDRYLTDIAICVHEAGQRITAIKRAALDRGWHQRCGFFRTVHAAQEAFSGTLNLLIMLSAVDSAGISAGHNGRARSLTASAPAGVAAATGKRLETAAA